MAANPRRIATVTSWRLLLAGVEQTQYAGACEWARESDEVPGVSLSMDLFRDVPLAGPGRIIGKSVALDLIVNGHTYPAYRGEVVLARSTGPRQTEITAATGGYWLGILSLGEALDFVDYPVAYVVFDMLNRNEKYNRHFITVEERPGLLFKRGDQGTGFRKVDELSAPLAAVGEEVDYFYRDNPATGGHTATIRRSPAEASEPIWTYTVDEDIEEFRPQPANEDYSAVYVYRDVDDVIIDLAFIEIPDSSAPAFAWYKIELSDDSANAADGAWQVGMDAAVRLMGGETPSSFRVSWINPLVGDGDTIAIVEDVPEEAVRRTWYATVERQIRRLPEKTQEFEVTMVIAHEEELPGDLAVSVRPGPNAYTPPGATNLMGAAA